MNKTRMIDDAQVRATAAQVEIDLEAISYYAGDLQDKLAVLHKELEFADPVKDRMFEKYLYMLLRFSSSLNAVTGLKELSKAMQEYGLPNAAEVREIIRNQKSEVRDQNVGAALARARPIISNVQKHIIEETINA